MTNILDFENGVSYSYDFIAVVFPLTLLFIFPHFYIINLPSIIAI